MADYKATPEEGIKLVIDDVAQRARFYLDVHPLTQLAANQINILDEIAIYHAADSHHKRATLTDFIDFLETAGHVGPEGAGIYAKYNWLTLNGAVVNGQLRVPTGIASLGAITTIKISHLDRDGNDLTAWAKAIRVNSLIRLSNPGRTKLVWLKVTNVDTVTVPADPALTVTVLGSLGGMFSDAEIITMAPAVGGADSSLATVAQYTASYPGGGEVAAGVVAVKYTSAYHLAINKTDRYGVDYTNLYNQYIVGSLLRLISLTDPTKVITGVIQSTAVINSTYNFTLTSLAPTSDPFTDNDILALAPAIKGVQGNQGDIGIGYGGTSTSSLLLGLGSKSFVLAGAVPFAYQVGSRVRAANGSSFMEGLVTAYSHPNITVNVDLFTGSGTFASWAFNSTGEPGHDGTNGTNGATGPGYFATSVSSITPGAGSKTFATQTGLAYVVGDRVRVLKQSDNTVFVEGIVTAYSSGNLTLTVQFFGGTGAHASWYIQLAGRPGIGYGGTSVTTWTMGTGSKAFTFDTPPAEGYGYIVGSRVRAVQDVGNWMEGAVTSISGTTITLNVDKVFGSGTYDFWAFTIAGEPGTNGTNGDSAVANTIAAISAIRYKNVGECTLTGMSYGGSPPGWIAANVGLRVRAFSGGTGNWIEGEITTVSGSTLGISADTLKGKGGSTTGPWYVTPIVSERGLVAIGMAIPWMQDLSGVPALAPGFVECNGQTLSDTDSPLDGVVIPDLNNSGGRFLKGSPTTGGTGGSVCHHHTFEVDVGAIGYSQFPCGSPIGFTCIGSAPYGTPGVYNPQTTDVDSQPPYYTTVYAMRVK